MVLEAARKAGAQKFIYISSMSIYDKTQLTPPISEEHPVSPNDFYSASKYAGEVWSRLYGESSRLRVAVLRCAGMYGPRRHSGAVGNFIARALANEPLEIERDIGWDLVYVTDIATAVVESLNFLDSRRFGIFNIGSGTETNIQELEKQGRTLRSFLARTLRKRRPFISLWTPQKRDGSYSFIRHLSLSGCDSVLSS